MSTIKAGRTNSTRLSIESDNTDTIVFASSNLSLMTLSNQGISITANSLVLPVGTTSTRSVNPITGETRYNTSINAFEIYNGTQWSDLSTRQANPLQAITIPLDYILVAGGGGGGSYLGGGGGGGGIVAESTTLLPNTIYTITIGAGGVGSSAEGTRGVSGSNTSITGRGIIDSRSLAIGGGGGGTYAPTGGSAGGPGGSGGGGNGTGGSQAPAGIGGAGIQPGPSGWQGTRQGFSGGRGLAQDGTRSSGGGGGAGQAGANATAASSLNFGGNGYVWLNETYYGGGGGGISALPAGPGSGGLGGGGNGGSAIGQNGSVNTGGGGGGCINNSGPAGYPLGNIGGSGGSGLVILRYSTAYTYTSNTTGNVLILDSGGFRYFTFYGSGTIIWN